MQEYRENGALPGWLLDPISKTVYVYKAEAELEILRQPLRLSGEPVLQGFVLDVPQIWAVMERRKS